MMISVSMERDGGMPVIGKRHTTAFLVGAATANLVFAQCANALAPSCTVYEACFARYCDCKYSPDEYFLSYGKTYCERFLENTSLSAAGTKWRDSTLRCLQEQIVPKLIIVSPPASCDCTSMRSYAFTTHVDCYTQAANSVCNLPLADIVSIGETIELKDAFSSDGWKTMKDVVRVCQDTASTVDRQAAWKRINDFISKY